MKTEDLIDALSAGIEPVKPARLNPAMLGAAALMSVVAVALILGVRPDLGEAVQNPTPWLKAIYTLALAGSALWLAARLGRPGADPRPAVLVLISVMLVAILWGGVEVGLAAPEQRMADWLGKTWTICGRNILLIAAAAAPLVFLSARKMAPTAPAAAGAALGVAAGGIAATAYGILHCPEATAAFVATWYTLGVATAGAICAVVGRVALRW